MYAVWLTGRDIRNKNMIRLEIVGGSSEMTRKLQRENQTACYHMTCDTRHDQREWDREVGRGNAIGRKREWDREARGM